MEKEQTQTETIDQDSDNAPVQDSDNAPVDDSQTMKTEEQVKDEQTKDEDETTEKTAKISEDFDKKLDTDEESMPSEDDKKAGDDKDSAAKKASDEKDTTDAKLFADAKGKEKEDEENDSVLDDELLTRAVQFGLSLAEARSFGSAKALETTLTHIERAITSHKTDTAETKVEDNKDEGYKPFEFEPLDLKFEKEDEIDPELLTAIKGLNNHYKKQIEAMNAHNTEQFKGMTTQMQSVQGNISNQASLIFEKNFDSMVKNIETDFETELGKGTGRSLGKDSTQMANRMKVVNAMETINRISVEKGDKLLPEQEVFNQAIAIVFADKAKEMTTKKTVSKLTQRSKQALGTPSGQQGNLDPYDKAIKTSEDFDIKIDQEES